jgi:FAD/FMN-containing dehydrogenase
MKYPPTSRTWVPILLAMSLLCGAGSGASAQSLPVLPGYSACHYCPQNVVGGTVGVSGLTTSCGDGTCDTSIISCNYETPENCPVDCSPAKVQAYYYIDTHCDQVQSVQYPSTTAEAQTAIQNAVAAGKRVNFVGSGHTGNQLLCTDGVSISTKNLNDIYGIEQFEGETTVRFQAGVEFWPLLNYLDAQGYALDYAFTGYGGITPAGAIATGVHGSNVNGGASISRIVRSLEMVGADGQIRNYSKATTGASNPELWRALRANLGALGMMTTIRLAVRPRFNLHMRLDTYPESALLAPGGLASLAQGCDYFMALWFPGPLTKQVIRFCGVETNEPVTNPKAANILVAPNIPETLQYDFTINEQLGSCDDNVDALEEGKRFLFLNTLNPPLSPDPDAAFPTYTKDLVGSWHRMMQYMFKSYQLRYTQTDWEVAVPMSQFDSMVNAVNDHVKSTNMSFSVVGALIRLDRVGDDSLLGGNAVGPGFQVGDRIVHFEVPDFVPWNFAPNQRAHMEKRWHDMMKLILDNYSVRPHWGKNQSWTFSHPSVLAENAARRARFQSILSQLDPNGVFARQHLANAGFYWPSSPSIFDTDGDGWSDGLEVAQGTNPGVFNGFRTRIAPAHPAGDCAYNDSWSEVQSVFSSSNVSKDWKTTAGWTFDTSAHNFTNASYTWNPWPVGTGYITWAARFTANFMAPQAGRYCFSVDNGATGSDIISGRNACLAAWWNQSRITQTGYSTAGGSGGSPRTACVNVTTPGANQLDLVGRWHDANIWRNFRMQVKYCFGGGANCTPNTILPRNLLHANAPN